MSVAGKIELLSMTDEQIGSFVERVRKAFGTDDDPTQAPPSVKQFKDICELDPYALLVRTHEGEIIGWSGIVPTSSKLADAFMAETIDEAGVIKRAVEQPGDHAGYVWAFYTYPEHRAHGGTLAFAVEQVRILRQRHPNLKRFFGYGWSPEGAHFLKRLEEAAGIVIEKPSYSLDPEDHPKSSEYLASRRR